MKFIRQNRLYIWLVLVAVPLYFLYIYDLTGNPPGFYVDEASVSFNAYKLYLTGHGEFGPLWPLYFPVMRVPGTSDFFGYLDPTQIYSLAALFTFFAPSLLLPRLLSATVMFLAAIIFGKLAQRISGRLEIGIIIAAITLLTPWLFELSRLAFGASLYPFAIILLLFFLHLAHKKDRWPLWNIILLAAGLALCTYTYTIGRLLGPLLALGLILFATNLNRFRDVLKTWIAYGLTLVPMLVFHLNNPNALSGRFVTNVGIIAKSRSSFSVAGVFISNFLENIDPWRLLFTGDSNLRHHIPNTGPILAATFTLAVAGIVLVIASHRNDPWWRYILFGMFVSIVPASLTKDIFHMLRLGAFPVFFLIFTVPALMWFLDTKQDNSDSKENSNNILQKLARMELRPFVLSSLLLLTVVQAIYFQIIYRRVGSSRGDEFDEGYRRVFNAAVAQPSRPIYLVDGYGKQNYILGDWYATVDGIDLSNFVHLETGQQPPVDALAITGDDRCYDCDVILQDGKFILYRVTAADPNNSTPMPSLK